jgi:hypothetical protein
VEAAHSLLLQQAAQRSRRAQRDHAGLLLDQDSYIDVDELSGVPVGAQSSDRGADEGVPDRKHTTTGPEKPDEDPMTAEEVLFAFDDAIWLNTALGAMWEVLDPRFQTGGVGPYISDMYADMVNAELAKVPPGVANVRLKRFELGHSAPLFKGVRVLRARNHTCLRASLRSELQHPHAYSSDGERGNSNSNTTLAAQQQGFLAQLIDLVRAGQSALPSLLTRPMQPHTQQQPQSEQDRTHVPSDTPAGANTASPSRGSRPAKRAEHQSAPGRARRMPFLEQFSAECDRLVLEMDCVYASRDMGVVLSLRSSDLQTLVPEVSVTLSEVHLSGQLRLNVSLTPDYPFIGTGQVRALVPAVLFFLPLSDIPPRVIVLQLSFMSAPQLAFSISSFGGLELSSMPYAYQWVNSSMHWLLEQVRDIALRYAV